MGVTSPMVRHAGRAFSPQHGCYCMQPDDQEEVQEDGDDEVQVQVQLMDPGATPYAAMFVGAILLGHCSGTGRGVGGSQGAASCTG